MRKHFVQEPAMWSPCHHQQHFHFVHKLHRSSCDLAAASSWASAFSAGPLPPCPLALLVLLNSLLLCQKTIPGWSARHWAPSTPHSCLGDGIYQSAMYWFFSPKLVFLFFISLSHSLALSLSPALLTYNWHMKVLIAQLCPALCNPMDWSMPQIAWFVSTITSQPVKLFIPKGTEIMMIVTRLGSIRLSVDRKSVV